MSTANPIADWYPLTRWQDILESLDIEVWRRIRGFEKNYKISTNKRAKSRPRLVSGFNGGYRKYGGYLKASYRIKKGKEWYPFIYVSNENGRGIRREAHLLVWETFVGPVPNGLELNHINGKKSDWRLSNLELVTHSENIEHAYRTGLIPPRKGEANSNSILTEADVLWIRNHFGKGVTTYNLAKRFNVNRVVICDILRGKSWKHVGGPILKTLLGINKSGPQGENVNTAKVTENDVRKIRALAKTGILSRKQIATQFGLSVSATNGIINFKSWKHVI